MNHHKQTDQVLGHFASAYDWNFSLKLAAYWAEIASYSKIRSRQTNASSAYSSILLMFDLSVINSCMLTTKQQLTYDPSNATNCCSDVTDKTWRRQSKCVDRTSIMKVKIGQNTFLEVLMKKTFFNELAQNMQIKAYL